MEAPSKARKMFSIAVKERERKDGTIRNLNQQNCRLQEKITKLEQFFNELKKKYCIPENSKSRIKVPSLVDKYKTLATTPFPISAVLMPGPNPETRSVYSIWKSRDLIKSESSKFSKEFVIRNTAEGLDSIASSLPQNTSTVVFYAISKSANRYAVLRKKENFDDKIFLEIWTSSRREKTFDLSKRKEHGKVNDNGVFSCLEWSANEKYLLYTAEAKKSKTESFFKDAYVENNDEQDKEKSQKGEENAFYEDWGETLVGAHHSVLCVLEIETGAITVIDVKEGETNTVSVAEAVWGPNDEAIVFIGYREFPQRLGIVYCQNRRSYLCSVNWRSKEIDFISEGNTCIISPHFSSTFENLFYLENKAGGPHRMCSMLRKMEWKTQSVETVVDLVFSAEGDSFPGIFATGFPPRCLTSDDKLIFFSSIWRSCQVILCINTETSEVVKLGVEVNGYKFSDCSVLDVCEDFIIASASSPDTEPCLVLGKIAFNGKISVTWFLLGTNSPSKIEEINWRVEKLTPVTPNPHYADLSYEMIVLTPKENEESPVIMFPHGGPHSAFTTSFDILSAFFVKLGYTICKVNYRGSIGFGDSSVYSLLGNVGSQDVLDMQQAAEYMKNHLGFVKSNFAVFGGSHGGFLTAHLCGQYPDFYKAAVCRNPVIDLSAKVESTDIPDWSVVEAGHAEFDVASAINPDLLTDMWEKSPVRYADKVTTPTLILLGKKDLRVPPSQGLKYYHMLHARGVPVKLYRYDDNHSLSKVDVEGDSLMHSVLWFKEHLNPEKS
ncbi:acylamino-acid-releasing enzyme-like [Uloborus diversus]|uniref:acylamino-acid-releasing enzyme-like n=1 Tax=Uloborus diversus TaxID=327109 RepID=UPI00240A158E|nr:acylamino-acid-releasing enzyme-like [Uloborus diversus]